MEDTDAAQLVGSAEAARAVGVNQRSLTRWVAKGVLRPTRKTPGGRLKWDVDDLRRQLAELTDTEY